MIPETDKERNLLTQLNLLQEDMKTLHADERRAIERLIVGLRGGQSHKVLLNQMLQLSAHSLSIISSLLAFTVKQSVS